MIKSKKLMFIRVCGVYTLLVKIYIYVLYLVLFLAKSKNRLGIFNRQGGKAMLYLAISDIYRLRGGMIMGRRGNIKQSGAFNAS